MEINTKNKELFRRLKFYGFGFALGLILVSFIVKGRGCQMPGSIKLEELKEQPLLVNATGSCYLNCYNIDIQGLKLIFEGGKINYDASEVRAEPNPTYAIEGFTESGEKLRVIVEDIDTVTSLTSLFKLDSTEHSCECE